MTLSTSEAISSATLGLLRSFCCSRAHMTRRRFSFICSWRALSRSRSRSTVRTVLIEAIDCTTEVLELMARGAGFPIMLVAVIYTQQALQRVQTRRPNES